MAADLAPPVTIVSGLPRSGTSMMMKMLSVGGMNLLTDDLRPADESNSEGYYEYEPVSRSRESTEWISEAPGRAVKVIYAFLHLLPLTYTYRILFMTRPVGQVVRSQQKMLDRSGEKGAGVSTEQLIDIFRKERDQSLRWIEQQKHFQLLRVDFNAVIRSPLTESQKIRNFLADESIDPEKMAGAVEAGMRTVS